MKKVSSVIAILFLGLSLFASSSAGTAASPFLEIGVGAKSSSLGDAFIGLADDFNAMLFNPSGLGFMEKGTVSFSHMNWLAETQINLAAAIYNVENIGTFGFIWENLNYGDFDGLDENGLNPYTFQASDSLFALSYGRKIQEGLAVGGTIKYITSEIEEYTAGTVAVDLGGLYKMKVAERPLGIGLSVKNVGGKMKYDTEGNPLPMTFGLGFSYGILVSEANNVLALVDFGKSSDTDVRINLGAEYSFKDFIALRLGYKLGDYDVEGFSGGLGAGYTMENGMRLSLDYAYGTTIEAFKDVHRISFSFGF